MTETDRPPQRLVVTLAALTVTGGFLDAVSYLGLGHVFTCNMTGNLVLIGFAAARAPGFSFTASVAALGCFFVGAMAGGRIGRSVSAERALLLIAVGIEATLTATATIIAATVPSIATGWPRFTLIALLAFASGVRNAAVLRMGVPGMTTTVLTRTLTGLAADLPAAGGNNDHAALRTTSVLCMFAGALAGALLLLHAHPAWSLAVASGIDICAALLYARQAPLRLGLAR